MGRTSQPATAHTWARSLAKLLRLGSFTVLLALISLLSGPVGSAQGVPPPIPGSEYQALLDLYQATDGPHWHLQAGWLDPQATTRDGVYVDANGHVAGVNLSQNGLTGTIPESLTNLTQLTYLGLDGNQLTGKIPPGLGRLVKLETLSLANNQLIGVIPLELGQLLQLKNLDLSQNQLQGQIPNFTGFTRVFLNFSQNRLNLALDSQSVANVRAMVAAGNYVIVGLLGALPSAEYQTLADLAAAAGGTHWQGWFDPQASYWYGVDVGGGHITALDLRGFGLKGNLPASISNLTGLKSLYLPFNSLTGRIPDSLGGLTQLQVLNLSGNSLEGPIPTSLGSLQQLITLDLSNNRLTGEVPLFPGIRKAVISLEFNQLDLSAGSASHAHIRATEANGNRVDVGLEGRLLRGEYQLLLELYAATGGTNWINQTGWFTEAPVWEGVSIAPAADGEYHVVGLYLSVHGLKGTLPATLGQLVWLQAIILSRNELEGGIPSALSKLTGLTALDLSFNHLTGSIPLELGQLTQLKRLDLSHNPLEGDAPYFKATKNAFIDLSYTRIDLTPGSVSRANLAAMIAAGFQVEAGMEFKLPPAEYQALLDLYAATDGSRWTNSFDWSDPHAASWDGVALQVPEAVRKLRRPWVTKPFPAVVFRPGRSPALKPAGFCCVCQTCSASFVPCSSPRCWLLATLAPPNRLPAIPGRSRRSPPRRGCKFRWWMTPSRSA